MIVRAAAQTLIGMVEVDEAERPAGIYPGQGGRLSRRRRRGRSAATVSVEARAVEMVRSRSGRPSRDLRMACSGSLSSASLALERGPVWPAGSKGRAQTAEAPTTSTRNRTIATPFIRDVRLPGFSWWCSVGNTSHGRDRTLRAETRAAERLARIPAPCSSWERWSGWPATSS